MSNLINIPTSHVPVIHDRKTAVCTLVTFAGIGIICITAYWCKSRIKVIESIRIKNNETDNKIRYEEAKTKCKMKVMAASQTSEVKDDPATVQSSEQDDNASASGGTDLNADSSADLFNRSSGGDNSKWIVDGYMRVGLVNLLVAGASMGKSNFMTQIALAVAKGEKLEFLPEECSPSVKLPVVYYRLEDFTGELEGKYGKGQVFNGAGIKWYMSKHFSQNNLTGFIEHLRDFASTLTEDTLVCIDPATKLDGYKHSAFIKGVEEAMEIAQSKGFVLTILASIHLDEIPDWKYLSLDKIKGGDQAIQKAGSVTAIRKERNGDDYRFLQCLKEPKGSPKPFDGDVLVMKKVHKQLNECNKYLHYEFDSIKPEAIARPEKTKPQQGKNTDVPKPSSAPNQKITPKIEMIIREDLSKGMKPKVIVKDIKRRTKVKLSDDYLRKYIRKKL